MTAGTVHRVRCPATGRASRRTRRPAYARRIVGVAVWAGMRSIDQTQRAAVTAALGPAAFTAATGEGARMRIPDALRYGLDATAEQMTSSLPGLGAPAQTSTADCDRPGRPVSAGVRRRRPPEFAPCRQLPEYKTPNRVRAWRQGR